MTDEKCSICRSIMDGTSPDYKLSCSHRFHTECIIDSLRHNPECPICRDTGGVQVHHWSEWDSLNEPEHPVSIEHINSCLSCGKKDPSSEVYTTFKMISELANEILKEKYKNLKEMNKDYRRSMTTLEKAISFNLEQARIRYKNDKINIYHNIGKSEIYNNYKKISKRTKILNGNFKRELSMYLNKMGYENDDKFITNLVNEYCKTFIVRDLSSSWVFDNHLKSCSKYSLDKYKLSVVNITENSLEI